MTWTGTIRVAAPQDWRVLRDIRLTALAEAPTAFGSTYEREAAFTDEQWRARTTSSLVLLAEAAESEAPVGTAALMRPQEITDGDIVGCFVRSQWRGTGVAAALIDAVVRHGAELTSIGLWVSSDNPRAAASYRRCGFVETGEVQPHNYPGLQLIRMIRRLDGSESAGGRTD